jgi:hypothetical protein
VEQVALQIYQLAPSIARAVLGVAIFLLCALLFAAVANPPTVPRMVLGALAVVVVVGLCWFVAARVRAHLE